MSSEALVREGDSTVRFANRQEAGERLADAVLRSLQQDPISGTLQVYALPRGGLPIAAPVAKRLNCPLDVLIAKKITRPDNRELAIGAVTADGQVVWTLPRRGPTVYSPQSPNPLSPAAAAALQHAQAHAQAQLQDFSPFGPRCNPTGAIALLVDDGIATGMTVAAAVASLRAQNAYQVWICAPVAPIELLPFLQEISDRAIVLATPQPFYSVSRFYQSFDQVSTNEARQYLQPE